jgi:hypothetical protein
VGDVAAFDETATALADRVAKEGRLYVEGELTLQEWTLVCTVAGILGDYHRMVPTEAFVASQREAPWRCPDNHPASAQERVGAPTKRSIKIGQHVADRSSRRHRGRDRDGAVMTEVVDFPKADRTTAERSRRYRRRKRQAVARPAPRPVTTVTPSVTSPVTHGRAVTLATLVAALSLAACSGAFSISGLTAIFAGAFWPVIGLGVAFEIGKLSAVAWLGQRHASSRALRSALIALVGVLMALNSVGVYGFLSRAHLEHALAGDLAVGSHDRRIGQIDAAVEIATRHGRSNTAMALADQQRRNRADLVTNRTREAKALADLHIERARVDGDRRAAEADLGPVRYLATLIGATDEQTMRWFILVVALLLDPAAVVLLLAATGRSAK